MDLRESLNGKRGHLRAAQHGAELVLRRRRNSGATLWGTDAELNNKARAEVTTRLPDV